MITEIKFQIGQLSTLREVLLKDLSKEAFALLLGKRETIGSHDIVKVIDILFPKEDDYISRSSGHVRPKIQFTYWALSQLVERHDIDTLLDVHTHPFSASGVAFSGIDDRDEIGFAKFLRKNFDHVHYGSIVFSQTDVAARMWSNDVKREVPKPSIAVVKSQTRIEHIPQSRSPTSFAHSTVSPTADEKFDRVARFLGVSFLRDTLGNQNVAIVGLGGLGSCIAESLIHMGFCHLDLIDPDMLEISNVSRVVGAYQTDAEGGSFKVDVVQRHLSKINPSAEVRTWRKGVEDLECHDSLAGADWIIVATDNHSSRYFVQQFAAKTFIPFISVGVNITVKAGIVTDYSGEIITVRHGDRYCLSCLQRLDPIKIAAEQHPDIEVRDGLVEKGYVRGMDVPEPAVKTLNAILSNLAVELLINQYTGRQAHIPILVYESNARPVIYADQQSLRFRQLDCSVCSYSEFPHRKLPSSKDG